MASCHKAILLEKKYGFPPTPNTEVSDWKAMVEHTDDLYAPQVFYKVIPLYSTRLNGSFVDSSPLYPNRHGPEIKSTQGERNLIQKKYFMVEQDA